MPKISRFDGVKNDLFTIKIIFHYLKINEGCHKCKLDDVLFKLRRIFAL